MVTQMCHNACYQTEVFAWVERQRVTLSNDSGTMWNDKDCRTGDVTPNNYTNASDATICSLVNDVL